MTLIVNGTIVDGTGTEGFAGSVLVDGERIADVLPLSSPLPPAGDVETIDAAGCLVTPGFIDCHAHSDAYLIIEPDAPSKISQGVTTEINGQCGGSAAPRYGEARLSSDRTFGGDRAHDFASRPPIRIERARCYRKGSARRYRSLERKRIPRSFHLRRTPPLFERHESRDGKRCDTLLKRQLHRPPCRKVS